MHKLPQKIGTLKVITALKTGGILLLSAVVSGCTPMPQTYFRFTSSNNATEQQFVNDRYECYKETQQQVSNAIVNQYGGVANSQVMPLCSAFYACLAARGYYRAADTTDLTVFNTPGNYYVPQSAEIHCAQ